MQFKLMLSVAGACLFWLAAFLVHDSNRAEARVANEPAPSAPRAHPPRTGPRVQLALLLDVSGSMGGLIDQAKSQLWGVVNRLSEASRDGVRPELEIALYTYGDAGGHHEIRRVLPFTTDLDLLSEELFSLTTTGGFEPAGEVILRSVNELEWAHGRDAVRLIVIAGNEDFAQGEVDYRAAIGRATEKRIVVSTVLCGGGGDSGGWSEAARLGRGRFLTIDHNQRVVDLEIAAPQDAELAELGRKLNETYVPYGASGSRGQARQQAQDLNSFGVSRSNMATRALSKASAMYDNSGWDLVDAMKAGARLGELDDRELPEALRGMSEEARRAWIAAKAEQRESIRARIRALSKAREAFIAAERSRREPQQDASLAAAILEIAQAQGLQFAARG